MTKTPPRWTVLNNDGSKTTDQRVIADKAMQYCGGLFAPQGDDNANADGDTGYQMRMDQLLEGQYDLWQWNIGVASEDFKAALARFPRNKTTGRGEITTEQWNMAVETNEEVAAAMAWATKSRFAHMPPIGRQPPASAQSTTFSAGTSARPKDAPAQARSHAVRASMHSQARHTCERTHAQCGFRLLRCHPLAESGQPARFRSPQTHHNNSGLQFKGSSGESHGVEPTHMCCTVGLCQIIGLREANSGGPQHEQTGSASTDRRSLSSSPP